MTLKELQASILEMIELCGVEILDSEVYVCIIRENLYEEKVKLESVGNCDGGYIPDGDEDKTYIVLDGYERRRRNNC